MAFFWNSKWLMAFSISLNLCRLLQLISSAKIGPGSNFNDKPNHSKINKISLKRIATSKSNSSMGPQAISADNSGFLQSSSKDYFFLNSL